MRRGAAAGARLEGEHALQDGALAQRLHACVALGAALRGLHLAHRHAPLHHLRRVARA